MPGGQIPGTLYRKDGALNWPKVISAKNANSAALRNHSPICNASYIAPKIDFFREICLTFLLTINGENRPVAVDPDTPLLWVLRDTLGLTGTKFGCGAGLCGACTVHIDLQPARSCLIPVSSVVNTRITTIEGLSTDRSHPLQRAWIAEQVPQCGYCQSGMLMAAAALLAKTRKPTERDINSAITNLCRCGTYPRVKRAILRASGQSSKAP